MRNTRAIAFLGAAVVCGVLAVLVARTWLESQLPAERTEADTVPVVVAAVGLSAGVELSARQVDLALWPANHVPEGILGATEAVSGRVLKRALSAGEPVLESALLEHGSGAGLTPLIRPLHRAMSVKVDAVVGVAGFVKPGARVDVLATVRRVDFAKPVPESQIILQDLRVLAIDQTLETADRGRPELSSVVTLEVNPDEAQRLAYAATQGELQLALRNPADEQEVSTRAIGVRELVSRSRNDGLHIETVRGAARSSDAL